MWVVLVCCCLLLFVVACFCLLFVAVAVAVVAAVAIALTAGFDDVLSCLEHGVASAVGIILTSAVFQVHSA